MAFGLDNSLVLLVLGLVFSGSLLVAGVRALWLYGHPRWLRTVLLILSGCGLGIIVAGFLTPLGPYHVPLGLAIAVGPLGIWLVARSIFYQGPPPGLIQGPKPIEAAERVLDSITRIVGLEHRSRSDEDDA